MKRAEPRSRRRRRWSTRTRILLGIGASLFLCWIAYSAFLLVRARSEANTGIDQLEALRASLTVQSVHDGSDLAGLARANEDFRAANDHIESPALMPLRILPVVGRQVRSVDALTDAASDVTVIAETRLEDARELLDHGPVRADERVELVRDIERIATEGGADLDEVRLGPDEGLVGPLARARDRFREELESLRTSTDNIRSGARAVATLLEGPDTYLLLAANNSEMRVGSGTFLSAGVLSTGNGSLDLGDVESIIQYNLPDDRVPLTGDMADRWGWLAPNREWRNLASSPRFDANAELAVQMWKASTGQDVDGVMGIDIVALQELLAVTGPVEIDGVTITTENVLDDIMLQQYVRAAAVTDPAEAERREHLNLVAKAVFDRLDAGSWEPEALATALVNMSGGRHLLVWSQDPDTQLGWEAVGVAGTMDPDSVLLGLHNRGTKLDPFLDVDAELTTAPAAAGTRVEVRVAMRNDAPTGLPQKVAGPYSNAVGAAEGRYQGLLVLQVPGYAREVRVEGDDEPVAAGPDGDSQVIATYVELDRGAAAERTITFVVPLGAGRLRIEPSARVPAVEWSSSGLQWSDRKHRTLRFS